MTGVQTCALPIFERKKIREEQLIKKFYSDQLSDQNNEGISDQNNEGISDQNNEGINENSNLDTSVSDSEENNK